MHVPKQLITVLISVIAALSGHAAGQLFGPRQLGRPLTRQAAPGMLGGIGGAVGTMTGNERFFRGNRRRTDFVGTDQRDVQGFVGLQQARGVGGVPSTTAGLRPELDRDARINQPIEPVKQTGVYHPKLQIAFETPRPSAVKQAAQLQAELMASERLSPTNQLEVSVAGRTAILRGEVTSARERDLAELAALVEPGISAVKNELVVATPARRRPPPPPLPGR